MTGRSTDTQEDVHAGRQGHLLRERVKELTCLYSLSQLAHRPGVTLQEILQGTVDLLPVAWQSPDVAAARIVLDGQCFVTAGFAEGQPTQTARIVVDGRERGRIDVTYLKPSPPQDEGPFLKEERSLIDTVARQVAMIVQRRQADEDASRMHEQLRHADRLATIGQLAAGVAHELNEPLGSILGFAQLALKCPGLPDAAAGDLRKVVAAGLHAREIIRKLMLFARQMPPRKVPVSLNAIVEDGLSFLESRCVRSGIKVVRQFDPALPDVEVDPSQLHQVLVNLVVNAIQAMPRGGTLTLATTARDARICLVVEDTGIGMCEEVQKRIFLPFFTTKDIDEGTGLGLPVVHGIVVAHGGEIGVVSSPGRGTRFEVRFPCLRS